MKLVILAGHGARTKIRKYRELTEELKMRRDKNTKIRPPHGRNEDDLDGKCERRRASREILKMILTENYENIRTLRDK